MNNNSEINNEQTKKLNKKLVVEDPLKPYKRTHKLGIFFLILFILMIIAGIITFVIYKYGLPPWLT